MSHCEVTPLDDGDTVAGASSPTFAFDEPDGGDCVARKTSVTLFLGAGSVALAVDGLTGCNNHRILLKSKDSKQIKGINANHMILLNT